MWKLPVKQSYMDYLLVTLMYCISGNPAFTETYPLGKIVNGLFLIILLAISGFRIERQALKTSAVWTAFLCVIFAVQFLQFRQITVLGSLNYIVKMLCAILFASYMGRRLQPTAINVMAVICLISLPLYILNLAGILIPALINNDGTSLSLNVNSILIYTQNMAEFTRNGLYRNSGMFWEPGAFAGYIIATFLLFVDKPELLLGRYRKQSLLLVAGLLTTMSTTGYILFFIFLLYVIFKLRIFGRSKVYAFLLAGIVIVLGIVVFNRAEFLGEKISKELSVSETLTENDVDPSRSGSIVFDMQYILSHPLFGNGMMPETRFRYHLGLFTEEQLSGFGNGFSGSIAAMGLLFMLAYLVSIGMNRRLRTKWFVILSVILLLQGEYFLNYPFFLAFPFIHFGEMLPAKARSKKIKLVWNRTTLDA